MRVFQVLNDNVLIINKGKIYDDTLTNFLTDGGVKPGNRVIYDDQQKTTVINDEFEDFPNETLENYIDNIDAYLESQQKRNYVPPTLNELKETILNQQYAAYIKKKNAVVWVDGIGFATDDDGQRDWQIALTLMGDSGNYKVYTSEKNMELTTVTKSQMLKAGALARAQQLQAYNDFISIREKIKNCKNADELKPYLSDETA
jgi:hypothetical protein